jgi:hypothetical protein
MVMACAILCPALLAAKPTQTPSRASRLATVPQSTRPSRARTSGKSASRAKAHSASHRGSAARPASKRDAAPARSAATARSRHSGHQRASSDAPTGRHSRISARAQRVAAARAAVLAANNNHRRAAKPRIFAPHLPTDTTETADDATDSSPTPDLTRMKSVEEEAATPVLLPSLRVSSLYDNRGHLIMPAPLRGSHEILLHQNEMADRDGLARVRDDAGLLDLLRQKKLVALPTDQTLIVDQRLPENRRYSRPWTAAFLAVLAHDYYASFHQPLQVNSAVRTIAVQQHLMHSNGNAAPVTGESASPHLTGQAVDIAKRGLSVTQIAWMRTYLGPLIDQGKIDVEEEFQQSCFHISVYKNYLPVVPHVAVAASQPSSVSERSAN